MYKHILIATDGTEIAMRAAEQGIALAKAIGAEVTAATVTEPFEMVVTGATLGVVSAGDYNKNCREHAEEVLGKVAEMAKSAGVSCSTRHESNRWPYDGIIHAAEQSGADLIVIGSHGRRGVEGLLLGSQAVKLLTHTKVPALVIR